MKKTATVTFELPPLTAESIIVLHNFMWSLVFEFDQRYFNELQDYYRYPAVEDDDEG